MSTYLITRSQDSTEWGLSSVENYIRTPALIRDVNGKLQFLVAVFEAKDYEQAKLFYQRLLEEK